ncbi:MAG: ArsJ-associated glyceraldehyde-3-phosphate dehydrogenase [Pseudomonadales bacterium]
MTTRVAINGFGRMGRLALRAAWVWPELEFVHINEIGGDPTTAAHLLQFDSVHGTWDVPVSADSRTITVDGQSISYSSNQRLQDTPWDDLGIDIAVECTGRFKSREALLPYLDQGVQKVVVSAPVKDGTLNIVVGVNDHLYQPAEHDIVTAASCTTNCIAPVISVIHEQFGIRHGSITTIHDITNTQSVLDDYHSDLRRARASGLSMIPTSTGSATAIAEIFPQLRGKLSGLAVRVPLANASVTDCVFEVEQATTVEAVNQALQNAAEGRLSGILGYETRPLVSTDFKGDRRSSIVDAASTMVIDDTHVKILAWYDNEIGYVNRMMELVRKVAASL